MRAAEYVPEHPVAIINFNGKGRLIEAQRVGLRTRIRKTPEEFESFIENGLFLTSPWEENVFGGFSENTEAWALAP